MKVFACKYQGDYAGGLIIVAANNINEAFETFAKDEEYDWLIEYFDNEGHYTDDITKVDSPYYPRDKWFEMHELTANVDSPRVICEDSYME